MMKMRGTRKKSRNDGIKNERWGESPSGGDGEKRREQYDERLK